MKSKRRSTFLAMILMMILCVPVANAAGSFTIAVPPESASGISSAEAEKITRAFFCLPDHMVLSTQYIQSSRGAEKDVPLWAVTFVGYTNDDCKLFGCCLIDPATGDICFSMLEDKYEWTLGRASEEVREIYDFFFADAKEDAEKVYFWKTSKSPELDEHWDYYVKYPFGTEDIMIGEESGAVANVQRCLMAQGYYSGQVNNIFGGRILSAVRAFQEDHGLEVTGVVDAETKIKLYELFGVFFELVFEKLNR